MNNSRHDLVLLVRLQGVYDAIADSITERNTPPPEIRELQEANRLRQEELDELEKQVEAHEAELVEVRKKHAEWELELEHFQKQKGMVTNEREFTAVISEIDYATKALEETSTRHQELDESIVQLTEEITNRREARSEDESAQSDVSVAWEQRKDELRRTIHELAEQVKVIESDIQPKNRARFLRLLESKRGTAVSMVIDGSCSLCHFSLRPHLQQRVRRCEEIIGCEHCHRILYITETLEEHETDTADG